MSDFFQLIKNTFTKKYFQLAGRASRKEYLSFNIFVFLLSYLINLLITFIKHDIISLVLSIISFFFLIYIAVPAITITIRRIHDINLNTFFGIIDIPILIVFYLKGYYNVATIFSVFTRLLLILLKGTPTTNKYGEPPIN